MTPCPPAPNGPIPTVPAVWLRRALRIVLASAVLSSAAPQAFAATFYVDNTNPAATDTGPGTTATPYRTITAAVNQHQGAGNTIMVLAGTYREQVSIPASGASGNPFVVQAASPSVTVSGADDFSAAAAWLQVSGDVWLASGVTWLPKQVFADGTRLAADAGPTALMPARTFQYVAGVGLYVNAGGGNPGGHGVQVGRRLSGFTMFGRSWVNIRGFTVKHAEDKGIQIQGGSNQCEITDNRVSQIFKFGIQVNASNGALVARNISWDNGGHGFALTAGSTLCTVEDNEAYNNADPAVRTANGLHLISSPSNLIRRNRWHHNQDSGQHLMSGSNGCVSIQNLSWNNGDHGYDHLGASGAIHVGDVARANLLDGFSIEGTSPNTQLHNCIAVENGLTTNEFDLWVDQSSLPGFVSDYNVFWNSTPQPPVKIASTLYSSVAAYSLAIGQDAQTFQSDPLFVNPGAGDFHLQPGSPAIDNANSAAPQWPATDANGSPRVDDPATPNAGVGPIAYAERGAFEYPTAVLVLLPSSGTAPLTVLADATGSLGPDGTVASYRFDFGDGAIVGPQSGPTASHTYAAGIWTATVTVTDQSGGTKTAQATASVTLPEAVIVERRVAASSSDAEEPSDAAPILANNDLDLAGDGSTAYTVGMQWTGITVPPRALITAAYVQFSARSGNTEPTQLTIAGQAADDAATFTIANLDISSRPRTTATASWSPAAWLQSQTGAAQRTTDLSAVIQEIADRPGWASGNALALIVTGTGHRSAQSFDGSSGQAPLLHIEYLVDLPPTAGLSLQQVTSPLLTVVADASTSSDPGPTPIASYRFDFGDGSAPVTTTVPVASAQHTYAAQGTYTVTVVATDTRGNASSPVSKSITLDLPPVASLTVTQLATPALTVRAEGSGSTDTDVTPIASYLFDFGDGTPAVTVTAPSTAAQHTYTAPGTYTVTLIATDTGGYASAPATASVTVNGAPVAALVLTQLTTAVLTVSADASGSIDADAQGITKYRFDFGDNTPPDSTIAPNAVAQHSYAAVGTYTVTVTAIDAGGLTSAASTSITLDSAPVAALTVTPLASPMFTVSADASASTDTDATPIASYRFDFGDGTPAIVTTAPTAAAQHTYALPGTYNVSVVATDAGGFASAPATASVTLAAVFERRIAAGTDDAEQPSSGTPTTGNSDLDLGADGNTAQTVGMRWTAVAVPQGAFITAAYVQFTCRDAFSGATQLTFAGQAADNPATFTTASNNVSSRPRTTATASWSPAAWTQNQTGVAQRTPDLKSVIQEVVSRPGWASGNALALLVTGTGQRSAQSFNGNSAQAPLLHIEYTMQPVPNQAPTARLTVTQAPSPALTVVADASTSTDTDAMPIASYRFDFGDGTAAITTTAPVATAQHTYAAPGPYTVTVIATDTGALASAPASASVNVSANPPSPPVTVERRVATANDDAEEATSGSMSLGSSDLEFVTDGSTVQTVGLRWTGLAIPKGATIQAAYIQFAADEAHSEATTLTLRAQAADNAATFASTSLNVSSRARTTAAATWSPAAWVAGQAGANQRTPDLTAVIQEVVNRPGWVSGNALAIIVNGSGHRTAFAFEGGAAQAALLHVEYTTQGGPANQAPTARLTATQAPSPALTVVADASASTDTDAMPIASYRFDFGDGTAAVTTTAPVATAQHTYAAAGPYTVSVIATDTGALASTPASANVTVITTPGSGPTTTVERRVATVNDDAEQSTSGSMYLGSSDLEFVTDGSTVQSVGLRWTGLAIPQGATIQTAYIQFVAEESQSEATNLTLRAEASDNAAVFSGTSSNITGRPRTTAAAPWSPVAWLTVGEAGANQRTPSLATVIQEVVNRPGWVSGNALAIIVSGSGHRTAFAFEGSAALAPLLHVEYSVGGGAATVAAANSETPRGVLPGRLALSAARPNPAPGPVAFRLELPAASNVQWAVYDAQGREVFSEERQFDAGQVDLTWDGQTSRGSRAGTGVYFVRLRTGGQVFLRRIVKL